MDTNPCVCNIHQTLMRGTEVGKNSLHNKVWILLCNVNNVFIFLHILLYLTFSMVV
jgi:hypothetical protein